MHFVSCIVNPYDVTVHALGKKEKKKAENSNMKTCHGFKHSLSNVTPPNNLLLNLYFKNSTIGLYVLYVFNIHIPIFIPINCYLSFDP